MNIENIATIQWFPGHMTKTFRVMETELKNVDMIIELLDCRIPFSSKNPWLEEASKDKPKLLVLNKCDLANSETTERWIKYYQQKGFGAIAVSSKDKKTEKKIIDAALIMMKDKIEALQKKGMVKATMRAMVVGVPNVGKSTLINCLAKSAKTKVADKPGVTRGKQWISLGNIDLLDMPGVLWNKFDDKKSAVLLAISGAIKDDVVDITELACVLLEMLKETNEKNILERYKLNSPLPEQGYEILEQIALKRGMIISKGEPDYDRAAINVIDEFRGCKLGRISLEEPPL